MFHLSQSEISEILLKKKCYINSRAACIEALKIVQKNRGWVCRDAIISISKLLSISACEVEGVATFYCHIFRKPVGQYVIRYCDSMVCFINGCNDIKNQLMSILDINLGETTKDFTFTLLPTCCLGACDKGPVILINKKLYTHLNSEIIIDILDNINEKIKKKF
ncbi:NADH-quinone oxidoreductase subunit NuoE [Buchnera aphidicola]|uniref:NADH-quinone oxidoreductase subunit E n=1 Tax=Buchnera aphidicola (Cinara strobi) TaxID=1921549 RepID=A0A3B1E083_9GAMM|nr:NADH-quinone oxidoreductase subunit NuoE [Buchnera aphidicola]VAX76375.1 NADH-quinone oxidoreductase subunit E [Buchnera aphidicola (Cinara strobi)]